jgi:hypothetical protein
VLERGLYHKPFAGTIAKCRVEFLVIHVLLSPERDRLEIGHFCLLFSLALNDHLHKTFYTLPSRENNSSSQGNPLFG